MDKELLKTVGLSEDYITSVLPWYELMLKEVERESTGYYGRKVNIPEDSLRGVLLLLHVNKYIDRSTLGVCPRVVVVSKVPKGSTVAYIPQQEEYYEVSLARLVLTTPTLQGDPYNNEFYDNTSNTFQFLPGVVSLRGATAELHFEVSNLSERCVLPRKGFKTPESLAALEMVNIVTTHKDFSSSGIPKGDVVVAASTFIELMKITNDTRRTNNNRRYVRPDREPSLKALLFILKIRDKITPDTDINKFPIVLFHGKGSYILRTLVSVEGNQYHSLPSNIFQAKKEVVKRLPHVLNAHHDKVSTMLDDGSIHNFETTPWKTTIYKFNLAELYINCRKSLMERGNSNVK